MASLSAPAPSVRPLPVTLAVVLSVLMIIGNLASPALPQGSGDERVPTVVIVLGVILGLVGILAAIGLWLLRRWGMLLTLVVTALTLLASAPGGTFGPAPWIKGLAAVSVLVCIAIIALVLLPEARRAYR